MTYIFIINIFLASLLSSQLATIHYSENKRVTKERSLFICQALAKEKNSKLKPTGDVRVLMIEQRVIKNTGHHPENNRLVTFRILNDSTKPINILGFYNGDSFYPTGYKLKLNKKSKKWVYPNGNLVEPGFNEIADSFKQRKVLETKKFIEFSSEMRSIESGSYFMQSIYIIDPVTSEINKITPPQFILK